MRSPYNIRRYGYGLRGMTPVDHQLHIGGKRVSVIGVISMRRAEDVYIHEGTVSGDVFEEFVCTIPSSHTAVFQWYKQALSSVIGQFIHSPFGQDSGYLGIPPKFRYHKSQRITRCLHVNTSYSLNLGH